MAKNQDARIADAVDAELTHEAAVDVVLARPNVWPAIMHGGYNRGALGRKQDTRAERQMFVRGDWPAVVVAAYSAACA